MKVIGYILIAVTFIVALTASIGYIEKRNQGEMQAAFDDAKRAESEAQNTKIEREYAPKVAACKRRIMNAVSNPHTVRFTSTPHAPTQWSSGQYFGETELGSEYGYFTFFADLGIGSKEYAFHCYLNNRGEVIDLRELPVQPK